MSISENQVDPISVASRLQALELFVKYKLQNPDPTDPADPAVIERIDAAIARLYRIVLSGAEDYDSSENLIPTATIFDQSTSLSLWKFLIGSNLIVSSIVRGIATDENAVSIFQAIFGTGFDDECTKAFGLYGEDQESLVTQYKKNFTGIITDSQREALNDFEKFDDAVPGSLFASIYGFGALGDRGSFIRPLVTRIYDLEQENLDIKADIRRLQSIVGIPTDGGEM